MKFRNRQKNIVSLGAGTLLETGMWCTETSAVTRSETVCNDPQQVE